jgi:hypothetical protein
MTQRGDYMDPDYNKYDSMHETMHYCNFSEPGSLQRFYHEAWQTFYGFENMKRILLNASPRNYWDILKSFIWYKNAAVLERRHPMMTGFFRRKSRDAMRSGVAVPGRWAFLKMRVRETRDYLEGVIKLLWEMQELWLQTRPRSPAEERIVQELHRIYGSVQRRLTVAEVQLAYHRARLQLPALKVPSKLMLYWEKWNLLYANRRVYTRADIDQNWSRIVQRIRRYKLLGISPLRFFVNLWLDLQVTLMFTYAFLTSRHEEMMSDG